MLTIGYAFAVLNACALEFSFFVTSDNCKFEKQTTAFLATPSVQIDFNLVKTSSVSVLYITYNSMLLSSTK
jgi:hypothetical protein